MPGKVDFHTTSEGHPLSEARNLQPTGASDEFAKRALSGNGGKMAVCCMLGWAKNSTAERAIDKDFMIMFETTDFKRNYCAESRKRDEE
jgi:hypothetical protein